MSTIVLLLLPDFLVILGGAALRQVRFVEQSFWRNAERMVYYLFFPALLFRSLARSPLSFADAGLLLAVGLFFTGSGIALSLVGSRLFRASPTDLGGCFQCGFRFNTYIALAAGTRLYGAEGAAAIGLLIGVLVPVVNLAAVSFMVRGREKPVWRELLKNPLIIACAAGATWRALGWPLPDAIDRITGLLANATLALALLAVGAGLRLGGPALPAAAAWYWHFVKLAAVPAVAYLSGRLVGLSPAHLQLAVLMAAVPTATSAYILAVQLGREGAPVAFLISSGTLLAMLTMPVWVALSRVG